MGLKITERMWVPLSWARPAFVRTLEKTVKSAVSTVQGVLGNTNMDIDLKLPGLCFDHQV